MGDHAQLPAPPRLQKLLATIRKDEKLDPDIAN